jgi:hypothetical protein
VARPRPLGGDGGGGFRQAGTGDGWGKGALAGRQSGGPIWGARGRGCSPVRPSMVAWVSGGERLL